MFNYSLSQLKDELAQKNISSVELTQLFIDRIKKHDPKLNSFISLTEQSALTQATQADQAIAQGQAQALTGLPIAHKDIFCTQGVKTSCASKMLDNFIAPYNATVVNQLREAGAIMLGKTNMDEFAMGSSTENSFYGPTLNPWDTQRIPGGSSGGSAAAVAARLIPAATGTDTGGSIRQPAALCGITGLKPTYGRVSRWGMIAFASSLDQAGPMTQSVADSALLLNAMAGHDAKDSTCSYRAVEDYTQALAQSPRPLKIGLPTEYFNDALSEPTRQAIETMRQQLEQQGHTFIDVSLPSTPLATAAYYVIAPAECSSNLARFDGVRYGYRCDNPSSLTDLYRRSRSEGFGAEVKRRILVGTYVLSSGYYDAYYRKAQQMRRMIRDEFLKVFESVDILLSPTTPTPAFKCNSKCDDPVTMYQSDIYTIAVNLAGLPALTLPIGFDQGLPLGAQLIAPHFGESTLIGLGHQYQQLTDWHQQYPTAFGE